MALLRLLCTLPIILLATACSPIYSRHIVGERIKADLSDEFNGLWRLDDSMMYIRQVEPGELRAAGLEWNEDTESFDVQEVTIILSRAGERQYLNIVDDESSSDDGPWHIFAQYAIQNDILIVWEANADRFSRAVRDGMLEGEFREGGLPVPASEGDDGETYLTARPAALASFVQDHPVAELFDLEEPAVVVRVAEE